MSDPRARSILLFFCFLLLAACSPTRYVQRAPDNDHLDDFHHYIIEEYLYKKIAVDGAVLTCAAMHATVGGERRRVSTGRAIAEGFDLSIAARLALTEPASSFGSGDTLVIPLGMIESAGSSETNPDYVIGTAAGGIIIVGLIVSAALLVATITALSGS